jgi:hypothetical protein
MNEYKNYLLLTENILIIQKNLFGSQQFVTFFDISYSIIAASTKMKPKVYFFNHSPLFTDRSVTEQTRKQNQKPR